MDSIIDLISSPLGPPAFLFAGALFQLLIGRWLRRPGLLTGAALFFVSIAAALLFLIRNLPVVPVLSRPWQPILRDGANLLWIGDGWNWYISGLILLLGGLGILLELNSETDEKEPRAFAQIHASLAVHLGVLGASLLFVGSGNLLTAVFTWVALDLLMLARGAIRPAGSGDDWAQRYLQENRARGLSLIGALLLFVGLLLAGLEGPAQSLATGTLPARTTLLMFIAALIRAGIYPFHLWLMPIDRTRVNLSERLLDQMVPVLTGLWLLGWSTGLGADVISMQVPIVAVLILALLGSATAAWTARDQAYHTTFVLITSAGLAALAGVLAHQNGPDGLIWPTTAFALGGGMWLVGARVWEGWGWQIPVSVGALTLAGSPITPGFLTQPSLSRMFTEGGVFRQFFVIYVLAFGLQIAAMLHSWRSDEPRNGQVGPDDGRTIRLTIATLALGLPLALAGFLPFSIAAMASMPNAIPPLVGNPASIVAEAPVWITLCLPLFTGFLLVALRPRVASMLGEWARSINRLARLEWLFDISWWGINQVSNGWNGMLRMLEGAGYMGWATLLFLIGYLLLRS